MSLEDDIAKTASLIGDKTRAKILTTLMQGRALTAGELALRAQISPQTASNHLNKLLKANLIVCEAAGRHRYYKLASYQVARALESLSVLTDSSKTSPPRHNQIPQEIKQARTCYDHLAGTLGVAITKALQAKKVIKLTENQFQVTKKGNQFFKSLSIDVETLSQLRRSFARPCLDWTEREHHLAGSLGQALLTYFLDNRLLIRVKRKPRVVVLTTKGKKWLSSHLSVEL